MSLSALYRFSLQITFTLSPESNPIQTVVEIKIAAANTVIQLVNHCLQLTACACLFTQKIFVRKMMLRRYGVVWYGMVEFNVPLDTV